jgi:uncharacterized protein (TIGR03437 family)
MQLMMAAALILAIAAAQEFPQGVDLVQRIDQQYPWLDVISFDVDAQGNTYLAGSTQGTIPATINLRFGPLGGRDIVVIKLGASGGQTYGTAIGGTQDEFVNRIKVDANGNLFLAGSTASADYPAQGSGASTVVLKLDPTGNILYNARLSWAGAILTLGVSPAGALYAGGVPIPGQLPVSVGAYRGSAEGSGGFLAKFDGTAGVMAATYVEGPVRNLMPRRNGDVLFSTGKDIAALTPSLTQLAFSTTADFNGDIASIGLDDSDNVYAAAPTGYRKYGPDGRQLLLTRDFTNATFPQFAVTPSGMVFLFGSAPADSPTHRSTQSCGPSLLVPILGVSAPRNQYTFVMAIGADGTTQYATFMADETPRFLPPSVSPGDGFPYALTQGFLTGTRWQGIVRFNPDELPEDHTAAGCLVHSATLLVSPIAPGTIMTLFGDQIGPEAGTSFTLQDGHVPFDVAGASVTVDGKPAPVLYAQGGQINFIAPWSLRTDGTRVPVCVTVNGRNSCLYAATAPLSPGLFQVNSQTAAINPDGTINSPQHPAPSGSYVSVYSTGMGQLDGSTVDGGIVGFDLQRVTAAVAASFTGSICAPPVGCVDRTVDTPVLFAGAVPTLVYGVNVVIVQTPSVFNTFSGSPSVSLTLSVRATPQSAVATSSGTLYISH